METNFSLRDLLHFLRINKLYTHESRTLSDSDDLIIKGFSSIYDSKPDTLSRMEAQTLDWESIKSAVVLCSTKATIPTNTNIVFIPVKRPRDAFALALYHFYPRQRPLGISGTAIIGNNCVVGTGVYIGHHVVIGDNVTIGDDTEIHSNVTVHDDTIIGSHCVVHSGTVIGADGFGYQKDLEDFYYKVPHVGSVRIGNHVEIGSNTCIARGKLSDTVIGHHVKIGNICHISHDVTIYENSMITHQTHIGGNVTVKAKSWIAPGVIIKQGVAVGENALAGMGAVVIRDVSPHEIVVGIPAKPISKKPKDG